MLAMGSVKLKVGEGLSSLGYKAPPVRCVGAKRHGGRNHVNSFMRCSRVFKLIYPIDDETIALVN